MDPSGKPIAALPWPSISPQANGQWAIHIFLLIGENEAKCFETLVDDPGAWLSRYRQDPEETLRESFGYSYSAAKGRQSASENDLARLRRALKLD